MVDATNDLVLTAAVRYDWPALRAFANSLVRTGFRGSKVVLVQDITSTARQGLLDLGFTLVDFNANDQWLPKLNQFNPVFTTIRLGQAGRYVPAAEFLKNREFRYVVWADARDVIFQADPSSWLEKSLNPHKLLGCTEGMKIDGEFYNDGWLKQVAHPDMSVYEATRHNDICCSGTIAGEALAMRDLMCEMNRILTTSPNKPDYDGGMSPMLDQGVWNFLRYTSPFKEITRNPEWSEGFCATVNWYIVHRWAHEPVPEFRDGVFYPRGKSEPFCIVHQYDRDPSWKAAVEQRYMEATGSISEVKAPRDFRWSKRI